MAKPRKGGIRKGDSVRIVNIHLGEDSIARRYLDRRGYVERVSTKNGEAVVSFPNRRASLTLPISKLQRVSVYV